MQPVSLLLPALNADFGAAQPAEPFFAFGPISSGTAAPELMELPLLNDGPAELWQVAGPVDRWRQDDLFGAQSSDYLLLHVALQPAVGALRVTTRQAYEVLLGEAARRGYPQLVRCWNYVPEINAGAGDEEQYKQFCWGRAEAIGENCAGLPAATGIGSFDGMLRIAVLASRPRPDLKHLENPRQVSAYHYPRQYGPRSPSFARATWLGAPESGLLLVSGTASIVDHQNRHEDDVLRQLEETRRNVAALVAAAASVSGSAGDLAPLALRLYLRDPADLPGLRDAYDHVFDGFPEPLACRGDICRSGLDLEVEAVFGVPG